MTEKVLAILEKGDYRVPYLLLQNYKALDMSEKELILIIYFINEEETFNPKKAAYDLKEEATTILGMIDTLCSKGLIELKVKNASTHEEYISLDALYKRLLLFVTNLEVKEEKEARKTIYDTFEQEFSRTLSPIEYELINGWLQGGFSEEVILLALKEAVYNQATNLRYVDKILYEWKKKGIASKEDYEKEQERFQNHKREMKPKKQLLEDYDWLNDSE